MFAQHLFKMLKPKLRAIEFRDMADVLSDGRGWQAHLDKEAGQQSKAPRRSVGVYIARGIFMAAVVAAGVAVWMW